MRTVLPNPPLPRSRRARDRWARMRVRAADRPPLTRTWPAWTLGTKDDPQVEFDAWASACRAAYGPGAAYVSRDDQADLLLAVYHPNDRRA